MMPPFTSSIKNNETEIAENQGLHQVDPMDESIDPKMLLGGGKAQGVRPVSFAGTFANGSPARLSDGLTPERK